MRDRYDVIVIGGGHAGTEAAWAAANALRAHGTSADPRVALITMDPSRIGTMSCNPAIGGLAKGQIVREIDALGGMMGLATDATGIQFRVLNTSKGAAVRGPRAQCDKDRYSCEIQRMLAAHGLIDVIAGTVDDILVEGGACVGVVLPPGCGVVEASREALERDLREPGPPHRVYATRSAAPSSTLQVLRGRAVVLTTGTFMRALMHTGADTTPGGRVGEGAATGISACLRALGFELGRLKTGTPPRLARDSIDFAALEPQSGDDPPQPFSDLTDRSAFPHLPQVHCWETHTTPETHDLIRANLHRAPMYSGQIDAECGPRYCPSIEDKVVRFADRSEHHVFLEPETLHSDDIYTNGISTSLPADVQDRIVHAMPGCARATIKRYGYAVEYDMVWPHQIDATGETKRVPGLFLAGQINGTSGYEEAGAQGLVAGLNAARRALGESPVRFARHEAYVGVLMDDLVTRTPREPYRMFTSRAEHRLLLRADNADERLTPRGREFGLVDDRRWRAFEARAAALATLRSALAAKRRDGKSLTEWALRPDIPATTIGEWLDHAFDAPLVDRALNDLRYAGYVARQAAEIRRQQELEDASIPSDLDPREIGGLRTEAVETLSRFRPTTMGQASRLAGITPGDMTLIALAVRRRPRR
ncbi:MAG: tRNA uridine-5-carboxymethylaminomethyl(34) synthesis enzyme MnmG [Phycisphaerae bacterium]|nr:tRNA uridine-5-carboxymethylaminomethyl(34) synthesis enzyme MnmG [Phycisphaerae bacterium]